MKVSIALATYNGERFLREQLDSLARQTLLPYELVVSDDQSADRTLDVIRQFAAASPFLVRVVPNNIRRGFADNFINALRHCTGDAVAYCDQDDVWNPLKLERCMAAMRSDPSVTLVHHDSEEVSSDLRSLGITVRPNGNPIRVPWAERPSVVGVYAMGCCMLVHRRVVNVVLNCWPETHREKVTESDTRRGLSHDIATMRIAPIVGTVVYVSDRLVRHRRHQQNTWSVDLPASGSVGSLDVAGRSAALQEFAQLRAITGSTYEEMAERAQANGDTQVADYLARVARRDLKLAQFCAGRAELYGSDSRQARLTRFSKMLRRRVYSGIAGPFAGVRCALKDMAFALAGPRVPQLLETVRSKLRFDFHPQELIK